MYPIKVMFVSLSLLLVVGFAKAETIHVDDDNATGPWEGTQEHPYQYIQDGIDNASYGDTVSVADGTYSGNGNINLDFKGKPITVTSKNGAASTTIDCEGIGRGFYFHSGETSSSVLSGFTITNGSTIDGYIGAICCIGSSPVISDNIITGNSAGGVYCNVNAAPVIDSNIISKNTTTASGGGIYCIGSNPIISNNTIADNVVDGYGSGGGILATGCSPSIINNRIIGNSSWNGGGIHGFHSQSIISNNEITANTSGGSGGGIFLNYYAHPVLINNTICGNSAGEMGGGIFLGGGYPTDATITLNTIIWQNSQEQMHVDASAWMDITYSDIQGGWPGEGNIEVDPIFVDATNDDYRLSNDSPCIGAGIRATGMPSRDTLGRPRPYPSYSRPDMGAYENPLGVGHPPWDVNSDGVVDLSDIVLVGQHLGDRITKLVDFNPDVNGDGIVDILDVILAATHFGEFYSPAAPRGIWRVDPENLPILVRIYNIVEGSSYTSNDLIATRKLLSRFISGIAVSKTELLQNYPNPFNPETWIPYELAARSEVEISIYSLTGQVVRTLNLGQKPAGFYTDRRTAAY